MKDFVDQYWEKEALPALIEFGKIPNVSPAFDAAWEEHGHMQKAATLLAEWVKERGVADTVEIMNLPGRTPLIFIEVNPSGSETVLMYGHFDKQPELDGWREGLNPWNPVREGDLLYGRGLADDGYAVFAAVGAIEAAQVPIKNVIRIRTGGVTSSRYTSAESPVARKAMMIFTTIKSLRRSKRSASAPAKMAKRNTGKVVAACTIATTNGDGDSSVISHPAPTSCIHVPMFETTVAIHKKANARWRNGDHGPV